MYSKTGQLISHVRRYVGLIIGLFSPSRCATGQQALYSRLIIWFCTGNKCKAPTGACGLKTQVFWTDRPLPCHVYRRVRQAPWPSSVVRRSYCSGRSGVGCFSGLCERLFCSSEAAGIVRAGHDAGAKKGMDGVVKSDSQGWLGMDVPEFPHISAQSRNSWLASRRHHSGSCSRHLPL